MPPFGRPTLAITAYPHRIPAPTDATRQKSLPEWTYLSILGRSPQTHSQRTLESSELASACAEPEKGAMDRVNDAIGDNVEVVPVVVVSQTFPARPSSIPDIRDFVRRCLAQSPLSEEDNREVGETVSQALLEAAGPTGAIN